MWMIRTGLYRQNKRELLNDLLFSETPTHFGDYIDDSPHYDILSALATDDKNNGIQPEFSG